MSDGGWIIEQVDPLRHLPALRQVYEQFGQGRPGYPLRGDAFWTHSARLTDGSWTRISRDRDGRIVAYLRVQRASDRRVTVQECPYVSADAAFSLMAALGRDTDFAECPTVGGRLPHDHVLGAAGEWSTRDDAMARAYTRAGEQLLAHLRDPTNQRTVYWSGDSF